MTIGIVIGVIMGTVTEDLPIWIAFGTAAGAGLGLLHNSRK